MILCDIGNTNFHFFIDDKEQMYSLDSTLPSLDGKVYYISVNEKATTKLKLFYKETIDLEPYINFDTSYSGMGLDRKMACLGVENAIIVDAGSAITVDIIKKGKHKGGFILPGLSSLKKVYPQISQKLSFAFNTKVNLDKIPLCTQDAISYGIIQSIIEPIKKISKKQEVIFTGGDGEFLSTFIKNSNYKRDLIFNNMRGIIDANNCIT
ncbi:type III pantothenate kinase [Halarcobacter ebronensis]|uniref:Type III pantothenate kinase n=1 Tax=Halarcobacter ebronensis TaxID=1462615 RepID=A0A4Q1AVS9_9BACT|nr:type III pantothenate kinase [Halarcobacter ebronensis]QKF80990.1 pantothenate kinase, type III [Halarcobacter ebronensis]RXK06304.1 pantothenate kinase [Halarcobacter ebronensis]